MTTLSNANPISAAVYLLTVSGIAMFCNNPILLSLSLLGAIGLFLLRNGATHARSHWLYAGLFVITACINPLFSHNGATVLLVINDRPITWEAMLCGITNATVLLAVLYWFRSFGQIFTAEKLLYLFGRLSPRVALVLSMSLRSLPLFARQAREIKQTQIALGLYQNENVFDRIKGDLRVLSVLLTWALENGIVTADSMAARGYGVGRRTHFSLFRFTQKDLCLLLATLFLGGISLAALLTGAMKVTFYPVLAFAEQAGLSHLGYLSYGLLSMLPSLAELEDQIKWRFLRSRI